MSVILQAAIELYMERHGVTRRGHVEFIGFAQRRMKEYGVHRDLEAYKRLFDVFPKGNFLQAMCKFTFPPTFPFKLEPIMCVGRFISQGIFESMTKYYPKQQDCAAELMQQMEQFNVIPDDDFGRRLVKIFGYSKTL